MCVGHGSEDIPQLDHRPCLGQKPSIVRIGGGGVGRRRPGSYRRELSNADRATGGGGSGKKRLVKCDRCIAYFRTSNRTNHHRLHSNYDQGLLNRCEECCIAYPSEMGLIKHLQRIHGTGLDGLPLVVPDPIPTPPPSGDAPRPRRSARQQAIESPLLVIGDEDERHQQPLQQPLQQQQQSLQQQETDLGSDVVDFASLY